MRVTCFVGGRAAQTFLPSPLLSVPRALSLRLAQTAAKPPQHQNAASSVSKALAFATGRSPVRFPRGDLYDLPNQSQSMLRKWAHRHTRLFLRRRRQKSVAPLLTHGAQFHFVWKRRTCG